MSMLKYDRTDAVKSRPARGEWIEIYGFQRIYFSLRCLAPRGASGLKYCFCILHNRNALVSPREGRVD